MSNMTLTEMEEWLRQLKSERDATIKLLEEMDADIFALECRIRNYSPPRKAEELRDEVRSC